MKFLILLLFTACTSLPQRNFDSVDDLSPGPQSQIKPSRFKDDIDHKLKPQNTTIEGLANAWHWKNKYYPGYAGGGVNIGRMDINELAKTKQSTGCHDDGLLMSSIWREMGVPTIMVDAMGIAWAKDFKAGKQGPLEGHVFVEVYLENHWWLIDSTSGEYISNYDPSNPVIPIHHDNQNEGYYVMAKGKDTWSYGVHSLDDLKKIQKDFAMKTDLSKLTAPTYKIEWM